MKKNVLIITNKHINTDKYTNLNIDIKNYSHNYNGEIIIVDKDMNYEIKYEKENIIFINNKYIEDYLYYINKEHVTDNYLHIFVMGEMLFGINHFILNILQPIILELDMLKDSKKNIEENIDMISESTTYLINIIQKLRKLKIKYENEIENINIKESTYDYFPIIRDFLNVHNIQTSIKIDNEIEEVQLKIGILENLFLQIIMYIYHLNSKFEGDERDKISIEIFKENNIILLFKREFIGSKGIKEDNINSIYFREIVKNINIINGDFEIIKDKNTFTFILKIPKVQGRQDE